ncbi:MAG: class I SAM-dependent methyltransferase [Bryobacteraceae bacterium]
MPMQRHAHAPSPFQIFDAMNAYQRTRALEGAIRLGLFTAIGDGLDSPAAIADRCEASEKGIRVLCDYMTVAGLLIKAEGRYQLTPESELFLSERSPAYMGHAIEFLNSEELMGAFEDVASVVRNGGTLMPDQGSVSPDNPVWIKFAHAMATMMMPVAEGVVRLAEEPPETPLRILDIAAGHGIYGITWLRHFPHARCVALDSAAVLEVARENAAKFHVSDRHSLLPGSAFEVDFGADYDVILLPNFLHHFDAPTCEALLAKVHQALKPGGAAITVEFVPNEDRVSPPSPATFALIMLISTEAGDAYTFPELDRMLRNSGFPRNEIHPLPPTPQSAIVSRKP